MRLRPGAINLVGIESPGLTAAVPIARYAIELMEEREKLRAKSGFQSGEKRNPPVLRSCTKGRAGTS